LNAICYVVEAGDTPRRIAAKFGVAYPALAAANPQWTEGEPLIPGERIQVPGRLPRRYAVQPGDSWASIAEKVGCSESRLREMNPYADPAGPEEGEIVEIPPPHADRIVRSDAEYGSKRLERDIEALRRAYPFLSATVVGRSVMGKPIYALRIGEGPFRLHANGAIHANEWITSLALMRFAEDYAAACQRRGSIAGKPAADLYRACSLWIVPMVNPDGVDLVQEGLTPGHPFREELLRWNGGSSRFRRWKANIRGVDLNDQFPACWEEERRRREACGPGPRDYGGTAPLTEPEARALAELTEAVDFGAVLAFHTQGEEIYWNYRGLEPRESEAWAKRLGKAAGYRPVRLEGSDAGYKDWFIAAFRRPGFTVEAGWGRNPLPLDTFPDLYDDVRLLLVEALQLAGDGS
jgi:g-D-glutamyl-meso-diaminopimelate peptidase